MVHAINAFSILRENIIGGSIIFSGNEILVNNQDKHLQQRLKKGQKVKAYDRNEMP